MLGPLEVAFPLQGGLEGVLPWYWLKELLFLHDSFPPLCRFSKYSLLL